jgi:hypothetical protein
MSQTVAELYQDLKYWIGEEPDALSLINMAVRFIAKRLYVLKSELVIGMMEVPIFAASTLTGSDIAFVDGGATADTITQVAAGFVTAGFEAEMPITTTSTTNPGPFRLATVAAGTLTLHTDDAVTDESAGSSVTITSDDSYGFLPSDFWGLWDDRPYLDTKYYSLLPLPNTDVDLQYKSAGVPRYYKVRGNKIYVTPHTSSDYTIKADYFQKPTTLENTTDYLPWDDLFNDVIAEMVKILFKGGPIIGAMQGAFNDAIDTVAASRGKRSAIGMGRGITYEDYL